MVENLAKEAKRHKVVRTNEGQHCIVSTMRCNSEDPHNSLECNKRTVVVLRIDQFTGELLFVGESGYDCFANEDDALLTPQKLWWNGRHSLECNAWA